MPSLLNRLFRPAASAARKPVQKARLGVERLEARELPASNVFLEGTVLKIIGDGGAENVTVRKSGSVVTVSTNNETSGSGFSLVPLSGDFRFDTAQRRITKIHFEGNGGDDYFSNYVPLPCYAYGGAGDDVLDGSNGPDTFLGGSGDDRLYGRGGNDWLSGNGDDDVLSGGSGADTLVDGKGKNQLFGGSGNDTLTVLPGRDRCEGGTGADTIKVNFNTSEFLAGSSTSIFWSDSYTAANAGTSRDTVVLTLDSGSFGKHLLQPVVGRLKQVREAVRPVISFLDRRLLPSKFGANLSVGSLVRAFGGSSRLNQFVNAYKAADSLASRMNYTGRVEVGRFSLGASGSGLPAVNRLTAANVESRIPGTTVRKLRDSLGLRLNVLTNVTNLLKLAMGRNVTLFTYNLPSLSFDTGNRRIASATFPIVGPIGVKVTLSGGVRISAGGQMSLDSTGFLETGRLLDGFRVSNLRATVNPYIRGSGSPAIGAGGWSLDAPVRLDATLSGSLTVRVTDLKSFRVSTDGNISFGITGSVRYVNPADVEQVWDYLLGWVTGEPKVHEKTFTIVSPVTLATF